MSFETSDSPKRIKHGFLRLSAVIAPKGPIPISRSTLYSWIAQGKFPRPVKLSSRISAWRVEDIQAFIHTAESSHSTFSGDM